MNRSTFFSLFLLFIATTLGAQLRESVVIVQPKLSNEGVAAYRSIAEFFRTRNLTDLADYFESLTKGGFGSGYIATDRYGRSIVVTNRHVVTFSDSAMVTVINEEGKQKSLEGCTLVYEDADIDCALLLLPQGAFEGSARLELAESVPTDGEAVWSAGYPGLMGKPSWQLGKGVIMNRRVVVDSIGLPEYAVFTQHSAPIDPGSSGGPLLVGDPANPSTLRVVGINTWVLLGRQSANFAVSIEKLREVFGRIQDQVNPIHPEDAVYAKAEKLIESLNGKDWSRFESGRYISSRMVMSQGWNAFTSIMSAGKESEVKIWAERFIGESPEETLRQAIYFKMFMALYKDGQQVTIDSVDMLPDKGGARHVRTGLAAGKDVFFMDWYEESGNWRILEAGIPVAGLKGPQKSVKVGPTPREQLPKGEWKKDFIRKEIGSLSEQKANLQSRLQKQQVARRNLAKMGWVSLGTGIVASGFGILSYFLAEAAYQNYNQTASTSESIMYKNRAQTWDTIMLLSSGIGLAGFGTSATFFLTRPNIQKTTEEILNLELKINQLQESIQ